MHNMIPCIQVEKTVVDILLSDEPRASTLKVLTLLPPHVAIPAPDGSIINTVIVTQGTLSLLLYTSILVLPHAVYMNISMVETISSDPKVDKKSNWGVNEDPYF